VVVNNGGGGIFRHLPGLAAARGDLARFVLSEHGIGFAPWAEMWACEYHLWTDGDLAIEGEETVICEVRPDPGQTEAFWADWNRLKPSAEGA
jgi:2-succinyl-5-enolpyruvyl-6-hydroxy-3-cyclohexene-1-carboxylate synthase